MPLRFTVTNDLIRFRGPRIERHGDPKPNMTIMTIRAPFYMRVSSYLLPLLAHAQAGDTTHKDSSLLTGVFWSLLPFLFLALLLFWFLRRVQSGPRARRGEQYMVRHEQHMERFEQSLDRIAKALEKKDTDAA